MKLKTVKSASKRILKVTKGGKIIRRHISAQHLATNKSKRSKAAASKKVIVAKANKKKIKRLVPYK